MILHYFFILFLYIILNHLIIFKFAFFPQENQGFIHGFTQPPDEFLNEVPDKRFNTNKTKYKRNRNNIKRYNEISSICLYQQHNLTEKGIISYSSLSILVGNHSVVFSFFSFLLLSISRHFPLD